MEGIFLIRMRALVIAIVVNKIDNVHFYSSVHYESKLMCRICKILDLAIGKSSFNCMVLICIKNKITNI